MKDLRDKVAVITGGASGIGFSLAQQALARGMRVVIADIEATVLERAAAQLDGSLLCVRTDVSNPGSVNELARKTLQHFGGVHLLFNNAGVGGGGPLWEASAADCFNTSGWARATCSPATTTCCSCLEWCSS